LAYGYAGHALGRHWEFGALPYLYAAEGQAVLVLALPVRWDPFPYSWPVHLVPFAGPLGFWAPGQTVSIGGLTGAGFSLRLGELVELYASSSVFLPISMFATSSVGARFDLANGFELGLGAVVVNRTGDTNGDSGRFVLATVTLSTLLGTK
jgi:hypothetical protein